MNVKEKNEKAGLKLNIQKLRSWHPVPSLHGKRWGKVEAVTKFIFLDSKILCMVIAAMKLKDACSLEEKLLQTYRSILKRRDITLPTKVLYSQSYGFSSSHVWM